MKQLVMLISKMSIYLPGRMHLGKNIVTFYLIGAQNSFPQDLKIKENAFSTLILEFSC
jgi:hypothetical protein